MEEWHDYWGLPYTKPDLPALEVTLTGILTPAHAKKSDTPKWNDGQGFYFGDKGYTALGMSSTKKHTEPLESLTYSQRLDNICRQFQHPTVSGIPTLSWYRSRSGLASVSYINETLKANNVIDVGCGFNNFGNLFNNCVGVDMSDYRNLPTARLLGHDNGCDVQGNIVDMYAEHSNEWKNKFDVVFCVGPLNFGTRDDINLLLDTFKNLLTENGRVMGHVRLAESNDKKLNRAKGFYHYPWVKDEVERVFTDENFHIERLEVESTDVTAMPDDLLKLYAPFLDVLADKVWNNKGYLKSRELAQYPGIKYMDDTIQYFGMRDAAHLIINEYCRRFEPAKYLDNLNLKLRQKYFYEIVPR